MSFQEIDFLLVDGIRWELFFRLEGFWPEIYLKKQESFDKICEKVFQIHFLSLSINRIKRKKSKLKKIDTTGTFVYQKDRHRN